MNQIMILADDLYPDVIDGRKTCTVRAGKRLIDLGPMRFESASGTLPPINVNVYSVSYMYAGAIPDDVAQRDGANNGLDLFNALHRFYPDLELSDVVTVVDFVLC